MTEAEKIPEISPPRWMTRVEKHEFRRLIEARKAVSNPVLTTEFDLLVDYVSVRSRIDALRRLFKKEIADVGPNITFQRHVAGLARQIDSSTSLSRKLGRDLNLNEPAKEVPDNQANGIRILTKDADADRVKIREAKAFLTDR